MPISGSSALIESVNLFDGDYTLTPRAGRGLISFYAAETDINLEVDLYARPGTDSGGFRGGDGGYSRVRFAMPRGVEFMIASFNEAGFIVMYRQSRVMLVVATGGDAGTSGNGGFRWWSKCSRRKWIWKKCWNRSTISSSGYIRSKCIFWIKLGSC
jgi:hypothetical protein